MSIQRVAKGRIQTCVPCEARPRQRSASVSDYGALSRTLVQSRRFTFDRYANGTWRTATAIPDDQPGWDTWEMLIEHSLVVRRQLAEQAASGRAPSANAKIVGDLWATGTDAAPLNARGIAPLEPELRLIEGLDTPA